MNVYVIARKSSEYLDTPVFRAGEHGREEAIAVFASREAALSYIVDAGWSDNYEVGELRPMQLVRWLATAHQDGTNMMVVDPERGEQMDDVPQRVVHLEETFRIFSETLCEKIQEQSRSTANSSVEN